ncbi:thiamine pyrophosphate-binding protein [Pectinatus frisingensis]|uniref:thiamine pyrophosphate-binding protein n=1 Tax=Pectinatus frisingensis TaxID=865 RepID=UPI0015F514E3|nr:thiamine pyrophosphate-binding protein [Pectinatus frisingensis]
MKIKVANYIADFLVKNNIKYNFTVTGGGAMHLNDALGHNKDIKSIYNHHEQASAMAAEAYARLTGKLACVCVTSGPGGTNAITGVLGGWLDSIPMLVLSGQVKRETTVWATELPLRQLGDQEYNIIESVKSMTKYAHMITNANEIRYHLEKMFYLAMNGRKGPVWLDVPLDIQAAIIETDDLQGFNSSELVGIENPIYDRALTKVIINKLQNAKRPVVLAGSGIRLSSSYDLFIKLINKLKIPVVTAWNAHDNLWDDHPYFCGRPGSVGTRGGNFIVENSDVLLVLGCRLNIRQISYNYKQFAAKAYKIIVDIDKTELKKPTLSVDFPVHANVKDVINAMLDEDFTNTNYHKKWLHWSRTINKKYPAVSPKYYEVAKPVNPYAFIAELFNKLQEGDDIICGNGSACVITFQAAHLKKNQRLFTNSGCAAMGYGFPAAIGCAVANGKKRTICIDGDGSFQMNIQELQTVVYNKLNIKIIYLNNNGYHSIRQTQSNLFKPPLIGVSKENGISFPDAEKIASAYGIPFVRIDDINDAPMKINQVLTTNSAVFCEVIIDSRQNFEPKLSSKILPDGEIVSPPIDDMYPFLNRKEYIKNKDISLI